MCFGLLPDLAVLQQDGHEPRLLLHDEVAPVQDPGHGVHNGDVEGHALGLDGGAPRLLQLGRAVDGDHLEALHPVEGDHGGDVQVKLGQ